MAASSLKIALVTGGGSGLGAAICSVLGQAGIKVVVADIKEDLAKKTANELKGRKCHALALKVDISNQRESEEAIRKVISEYGRIDILINNAGIDRTVSIEDMEIDDWDRILAINLRAPFLLAKNAFPIMKEQKSGSIINIISTAAKRAWPNASAYHASKWGLLGFTYALHTEARLHNIKVTAVVCGGMRTPFLLDRFPDISVDTLQDPINVAKAIYQILNLPDETIIPEIMILPIKETSWP